MVRKIVRSGDPILRVKSKPVGQIDKKIKSLIQDLKDTLVIQKDPEGVGLAAPQIGKNFRVFVMIDGHGGIKAVINPEIISSMKEKEPVAPPDKPKNPKAKKLAMNPELRTTGKRIMEGCLSLPFYYGPLKRDFQVVLKYLNETGNSVTETFTGFPAQIVGHEIDHLNGVLFIDRLLEQKKSLYKLEKDEWEKVEI